MGFRWFGRRSCRALVIISALAASAAGSASQAQDVGACVDGIGADMINAAQKGTPQAFYGVIDRHADNQTIALLSLGQYRKLLPPDRIGDYTALVKQFIAKTLADNYRKFRASSVVVTSTKAQGNAVNVETSLKFLGGRPSQKVIWKVSAAGNDCKVLDVNVTNVWLGQLLRSSVTSAIQNGGQSIDAAFIYLEPAGSRRNTEIKVNR
ncbi:ABC-type transporter MlaC component [Rhodoligotrophos appendicifer]|uniref:Tgt2/MlaC family protein n=1 Tax=Rhodoligotrophos appendicifer TaxID=987056 RepID=UPI0014790208|nr:ABC transporter substrate-binding protein [Rhodoligotrophos appendicifer]